MALVINALTAEDLNGECFIAGSAGEIEENNPADTYVFPPDRPDAYRNDMDFNALTNEQKVDAGEWLHEFLIVNISHLLETVPNLSGPNAAKIAYIRMLCVRMNIVKQDDPAAAHHCKYTLRRNLVQRYQAPNAGSPTGLAYASLDENIKRSLKRQLYNMIACVAYMFRVRAHHWTEDIDKRYKEMWLKVSSPTAAETPGLDWQYVARNALHAIYPDDLDRLWLEWAKAGKISRPLVIRMNAAAAGTAGILALRSGLNDLKGGMPKIAELLAPHEEALIRVENDMAGNRWKGSVNHNYYGVQGVVFNESEMGAAAAFVIKALETLSPEAPLAKSPALRRIANSAPITGAMFSRYLIAASKSPEAIANLMAHGQ